MSETSNNWSITLRLQDCDGIIRRNTETGAIQVRTIMVTPWSLSLRRVEVSGPALKKDKTLALFDRRGSMPINELPAALVKAIEQEMARLATTVDQGLGE